MFNIDQIQKDRLTLADERILYQKKIAAHSDRMNKRNILLKSDARLLSQYKGQERAVAKLIGKLSKEIEAYYILTKSEFWRSKMELFVLFTTYEGNTFHGVFSSHEKAETAAPEIDQCAIGEIYIETVALDELTN